MLRALCVCSVVLFSVLGGAFGVEVPGTALITTNVLGFNPVNQRVYAVDQRHDCVWVIDPETNTAAMVRVGAAPDALAVDERTGRVYVANSRGGSVSVLDARSSTAVATVPSGPHPYMLAVDSQRGKVFVTNTFSDLVAEIDAQTNAVQFLHIGSADNVVVDSPSRRVFLLSYEDPAVKLLTEPGAAIRKLGVGEHLWGMALNSKTGAVYVTRTGDSELVEIDPNSGMTKRMPVGAIPCSVTVNSRTGFAYVANYGDSSVTAIDITRGIATATIPVGLHPQAIALDAKRDLVLTANTHGNSVTVIDGATQKVSATLPAGRHPYCVLAVPKSSKIVVANLDGSAYTIVDLPSR